VERGPPGGTSTAPAWGDRGGSKAVPDAICHFNGARWPAQPPGQGGIEKLRVTDFVVDSDAELSKMLAPSGKPAKRARVRPAWWRSWAGRCLENGQQYVPARGIAEVVECAWPRDFFCPTLWLTEAFHVGCASRRIFPTPRRSRSTNKRMSRFACGVEPSLRWRPGEGRCSGEADILSG